MSGNKKHKGLKIAAYTLGSIILLLILLPFTLYIPWVQNIAKNIACDYVNRTTGLTIGIDRVLVKYPLDVSLDGVFVLDEKQDTMLRAGNLTASIAFRPLLDLQVNVDEARLRDAYYHLVSEDSSMVLTANVDYCRLKGAQVDLERNMVNVLDGELTGGKVDLDYRPWKVVYEQPDSATTAWKVSAYHLTLNDIDYTMTMLPTIDKMTVHLARANLEEGVVDTGAKEVIASMLGVDSVDCRYTYYDTRKSAEFDKNHPLPVDTFRHPASDSIPWVVKIDSVSLKGGNALYAVSGKQNATASGLDMDYIKVDDINLGLNNFYNRGTDVNLVLSELTGRERSGLTITSGTGGIALNDKSISLKDFKLKTGASEINIDTQADMSLAGNPPQGNVRMTTDSRLSLDEMALLYPDLSSMTKGIPRNKPVLVRGSVNGNPSHLRLDGVNVDIPQVLTGVVTGTVDNILDTDRLSGDLDINAKTGNLNQLKGQFLDKVTASQVNLPPMALKGRVQFTPSTVKGNANITSGGGTLVGKGEFNSASQGYNVDATLKNFPVGSFMPSLGVGNVTADVKAQGKGFDFTKPTTSLNAKVDLGSLVYNKGVYRNINADVHLSGGKLDGTLVSSSSDCDLRMNVDGTLNGDRYALNLNGVVNQLDLKALNLYDGECYGSAVVDAVIDLDLKRRVYSGNANLTDVKWHLDGEEMYSDATNLVFSADDKRAMAQFSDEGSSFSLNADCGLDDLMDHFVKVGQVAMEQLKSHSLNIDTLQRILPQFDLSMKMGPNGIIQRYLAKYDIDFRDVDLTMRNDSNIYIDGSVLSLAIGETVIDTLTLKASEWNKYLRFDAHMGNRPGTWDEFAQVDIHGGAIRSSIDFLIEQRNISGEMGYRFGANASLRESDVAVRLFPHEPIIGYRQWVINDSNYINIDYRKNRIRADVNVRSDESVISLTSVPAAYDPSKDDIDLKIENLKIEEWTNILPSLADMTGVLDADIQLDFDGRNVEGKGDVKLGNFTYNNRKEGDIAMKTQFAIDPLTASTRVNADFDIDGSTVAVAAGALNDSTSSSPFHVDLDLKRFPLKKANPFIPGKMVRLDGFLTGNMNVTGTMDKPVINGFLAGDSAMVKIPRYGSSLLIADDSIPVRNNVIRFNGHKIYGLNNNPLMLNGVVDARDFDKMDIDLTLRGKDVQFIGAEQRRFSEMFGKGFVDLDGRFKMKGDYVDLRADVNLLTGSNITYVLQDDVSSLTGKVDKNMVTFINPNDTTGVDQSLITAVKPSSVNVLVNIDVQEGAKLNAFLSEDGEDRATVEGSGHLKYSLDFAGKDNLTGSYTATGGVVRYSLPVISQKVFNVDDGSQITWNGEMLNPTLDLSASNQTKCSVTDEDKKSRLVEFEIKTLVGGTLSNMDLQFDLEALNDMSVANELQSMTVQQRSQTAINMLLYNTYSGLNGFGTSTGAINFNAQSTLFSFLQSKLNSWAASSIKGLDISFGINQYDTNVNGKSGTMTSYSYRLSKTLFDDRFKIVIGGEYSTDATSEENFSQNLINDISFEYLLNKTGSRYVRLFRHTGYESILEGQVTKTGIGFVMKHKASTIKSLLYPSWGKKRETEPKDTVPVEVPKEDTVPQDGRPAVNLPEDYNK